MERMGNYVKVSSDMIITSLSTGFITYFSETDQDQKRTMEALIPSAALSMMESMSDNVAIVKFFNIVSRTFHHQELESVTTQELLKVEPSFISKPYDNLSEWSEEERRELIITLIIEGGVDIHRGFEEGDEIMKKYS
jgi:hypothetical protein